MPKIIVVGVDGSPESLEALRWAVEEGRLRGVGVRAVLAWSYPHPVEINDPYLVSAGYEPLPVDPQEPLRMAKARLSAAVAEAVGEASIDEDAIEGHAGKVLVTASRGAELLVVGSRGHGGFGGLLLGSVSQACAHHAACPVVIIRSEQHGRSSER